MGSDHHRDIVIISTLRMKRRRSSNKASRSSAFWVRRLNQLEKLPKPFGPSRTRPLARGVSARRYSVANAITQEALWCSADQPTPRCRYPRSLTPKAVCASSIILASGWATTRIRSTIELIAAIIRMPIIIPDAGRGSDYDDIDHVRAVDADTPARFNADPKRLHEASGCAGKPILCFAARYLPGQKTSAVFYIGANDADELETIRRRVLSEFSTLPISGEYLHRDAFDIADEYGKDTFLLIYYLGTERMPPLFALKGRCDAYLDRLSFLPSHLIDRILQGLSAIFPNHLPPRIREFRDKYEHHLMLKVAGPAIEECRSVRRQSFWDRRRLKIREILARLVCDLTRPADGAASGDWRWSVV